MQDLPCHIDLDIQFPDLSRIVREVHKVRLSDLAERYPANGFEFYDLERLCAAVQAGRRERNQIGNILDEPGTLLWALKILAVSEKEPARVYLGILNEYVKRGFVEKASQKNFVRHKVLCKMKPRAPGCSPECLDTIAECSWALLFSERFERVEEEKPLPGVGNADFCCKRPGKSDLWIDCVSPNPDKDRFAADPTLTLEGWIARQAENKWKSKFGKAHWQLNNSATAVAITLLKTKIRSEKDREASTEMLTIQMLLDRKRTLGEPWGAAPDRLWARCPGLEIVWVGEIPQSGDVLSPNLICEWHRPTP
jgi:hypothetical protein